MRSHQSERKTVKLKKLNSSAWAGNTKAGLWRLFAHLVISPLLTRNGAEMAFEWPRRAGYFRCKFRSPMTAISKLI